MVQVNAKENSCTVKRICEVKIAGQLWTIETVNSHDASLMANGESCFGTAWPAKMKIFISNELSGDRLKRTIKHELTHAYINATQCSRNETFSEEELCDFIAIYGEAICDDTERVFETL